MDVEGAPVTEQEAMEAIKPVLQKIIRDNRAAYKKEHYDGKTDEQLKTCPIPGMSQEDWVLLVKYWDNVRSQGIDEQNSRNRQKLKTTHTLGSKSLPRFLEEQVFI